MSDQSEWQHTGWFEHHEALPIDGTIGAVPAMGGRIGAECATCHERLVPRHEHMPIKPPEATECYECAMLTRAAFGVSHMIVRPTF